MPILLASELLPMPLSRYVGLTMSHTSLVDFEVTNWFALTRTARRRLNKSLHRRLASAAQELRIAEKKALQSMAAGGSTVTPVKLEPFIKLAEQSLRKQVKEAGSDQSKLESAKGEVGVLSRRSANPLGKQGPAWLITFRRSSYWPLGLSWGTSA